MQSKKDSNKTKGNQFFEDLQAGLEDVVAYKKGKLTLRSTTIEIPDSPTAFKAKDVKKIQL